MERDVHGVTPGALDHPVQHALLDCHGNWIGVIGMDERTSSKYQSGWIRRMGSAEKPKAVRNTRIFVI